MYNFTIPTIIGSTINVTKNFGDLRYCQKASLRKYTMLPTLTFDA